MQAPLKDLLSSDLLEAVCHDLRGPLGAIANWVHVLGFEKVGGEARAQALASMAGDVRALGALIDQLSALGSTLGGTPPLSLAPIDLVPVLSSAGAAATLGIEARVDLEMNEPSLFVLADAPRLKQIGFLLVSRALSGGAGLHVVRVARKEAVAEIAVETTRPPRALSLALARALTMAQGGAVDHAVADGKSVLRVLLPLAV